MGLPECIEGRDPTDFIEQWLITIFGKEAFTLLFTVERAHRTPTRPLPPGYPSRPFLARLLELQGSGDHTAACQRALGYTLQRRKKSPFTPTFRPKCSDNGLHSLRSRTGFNSCNLHMRCFTPPDLCSQHLGNHISLRGPWRRPHGWMSMSRPLWN